MSLRKSFSAAPRSLAALNQGIENETFSVDGTPEPMPRTGKRDHDLIKMLTVAKLRCAGADFVGIDPSEFRKPTTAPFHG